MKYKNFTCTPRYSNAEKMYYGSIDEIPEPSTLEAANLEDFERIFHDAVDEHLKTQRSNQSGKKRFNFILPLILLGLIVAMALSCPKKEQHTETLTRKISSVLLDGEDSDIATLGRMLGNPVSRLIVNTYVTVDDYFLCSIGKFDYEGKKSIVSVGAFGHVFTMPKSKIKRRMEQDPTMRDLIGNKE